MERTSLWVNSGDTEAEFWPAPIDWRLPDLVERFLTWGTHENHQGESLQNTHASVTPKAKEAASLTSTVLSLVLTF